MWPSASASRSRPGGTPPPSSATSRTTPSGHAAQRQLHARRARVAGRVGEQLARDREQQLVAPADGGRIDLDLDLEAAGGRLLRRDGAQRGVEPAVGEHGGVEGDHHRAQARDDVAQHRARRLGAGRVAERPQVVAGGQDVLQRAVVQALGHRPPRPLLGVERLRHQAPARGRQLGDLLGRARGVRRPRRARWRGSGGSRCPPRRSGPDGRRRPSARRTAPRRRRRRRRRRCAGRARGRSAARTGARPASRRPPPGAAGAACSRRTTPRRPAGRAGTRPPSAARGRAAPARGRPGRARARRRAGRRACPRRRPVTCSISSWIGASPSATRSSSATTLLLRRGPRQLADVLREALERDALAAARRRRRRRRAASARCRRAAARRGGTSSDSPAAIARRPCSRIAADSSRSRAGSIPVSWSSSGDWTATPDCGQTTHQPMRAIRCASASARSLSRSAASVRACSVTSTASTAARRRPSCSSGRADADEAAAAGPVQLAAGDRPPAGQHLARELGHAGHAGQRGGREHRLAVGGDEREADRRAGRQTLDEGRGRELLLPGHGEVLPRQNGVRGPLRDTWRAGRRGRARADRRLPGAGQALAPRPRRGRGGGAAHGRDQRRLRPAAGRDRARARRPAGEAPRRPRELAARSRSGARSGPSCSTRSARPRRSGSSRRRARGRARGRCSRSPSGGCCGCSTTRRSAACAGSRSATSPASSLRVRRRGATLSLRTTGGRRHSFADLRPPTAAVIERHLRDALRGLRVTPN